MHVPSLPLTDFESFAELSLPEQINLLRPRVEAELLDALLPPDPVELFELLNIQRGELTCSVQDWSRWCATVELAYVYGLCAGRIIASGFRIPGKGGAR